MSQENEPITLIQKKTDKMPTRDGKPISSWRLSAVMNGKVYDEILLGADGEPFASDPQTQAKIDMMRQIANSPRRLPR